MPIFEYRCQKCGTEFERLLRHSERDNPQKCANPKCESTETKKMVSRTSLTFCPIRLVWRSFAAALPSSPRAAFKVF